MLVFASAAQAKAKSRGLATLAWILAVVSLFILIVIDYWPVWITLIAGLGTFIAFSMVRPQAVLHPSRFVLPSLLLAAAALFLFALPNPFSVTVPQEVTLNYNTSADIVQKTWNETSPWWGSGPGTFMFRYAQDHGTEVNSTSFWDTRFDRASSHLLTLAASIGKIGLVAWGVFAAAVLGVALLALARKKPERDELVVAPLCAFVAIVAGLCAYTANTTLVFAFFVVSAWVVGCSTSAAWHRSFKQSPAGGLAIGTLFVVSLLAISTGVFLCGQRYVAEAAFAKAVRLDRNGGDVQDILSQVDRAASANRFEDIYYRNLAQALLQKLADEMQNVDDTQKIADDKQQYLLALTSAGVNAAVHATDLSPNQALNWLARGDVYRSLIPLSASAGDQALAAYAKAASLEPSNPSDVTELGKAYLAIAAQEQTLAAGASGEEKTAAENRVQGALQHAEAAFLQAITLKADYGPAHFELALTYEQQGRLDDAVGKMESVAKYNSLDIGVAFQLGLLYVRRGSEGDVERAQEQFEHVVSLAPSYSNARWFLASIYEQEGKIDAAIQQIEAVLSLNPDNEIVKARLERLKSGVLSPEIPPVLTDGQ
jgi:tetratricopeptide (TPR) repeat protein